MSAKHTDTPWLVVPSEGGGDEWEIVIPFPGLHDEYLWIATCSGMGREYGDPRENAAFIGLAVNSHDELVAALRGMVKRGGAFDEPLGASEQSPEVNAAISALSRISDVQIKGAE